MTLKEYLSSKMKMSGLYQPLIIKHLILGNGTASLESIAKELTTLDYAAVDDYVRKLKIHPKSVLSKHGIAEIEKDSYKLTIELGDSRENLINYCNEKITTYLEERGIEPGRPTGWGAKRVKLISESPYCKLCGARPSDGVSGLDIDHIVPISNGGSDDESNLQVLCAKCNRAKGNHLVVSASSSHAKHLNHVSDCVFCTLKPDRIKYQDNYILVIEDGYPVAKGHTLIIPVRHIPTALDLHDIEVLKVFKMCNEVCASLQNDDQSIVGFNLGFNVGRGAGQTIDHCHFHIIPRRTGDVEDPTGGIRNVIPGKGVYE